MGSVELKPSSRFAFAWTNQPVSTPQGLIVLPPKLISSAEVDLGWKQLDQAIYDAAGRNLSNDWAYTLWVRRGGKYLRLLWDRATVDQWLLMWRCYGPDGTLPFYAPVEE